MWPNFHASSTRNADEEDDDQLIKVRWRSLFNFTTTAHLFPLVVGVILSFASGITIPALAIFLGRIFDSFVNYGGDTLTSIELVEQVSQDGLYLLALGCVSWMLNGSYFMFWIVFGELQAKSVRDMLFESMLGKEVAWYDMRKTGVNSMVSRFQT